MQQEQQELSTAPMDGQAVAVPLYCNLVCTTCCVPNMAWQSVQLDVSRLVDNTHATQLSLRDIEICTSTASPAPESHVVNKFTPVLAALCLS